MAMVLGIAGGVISAIGAMQSANAQAAAADYNKEVALANKKQVHLQTEREIDDRQAADRRQLSSMRAAYGANGLQMDGSPLDVIDDTATEMAYDIAKVKYQGAVQEEGYSREAALAKLEAKSAKKAGFIGAASALIGGLQTGISNSSSGSSFSFA